MAVSYSSKKCDSCGGSLEYIKSEKIWRCRYCGQEIVREESYDGLFTIKNVVRQTLVDVAYRRMDQASKNLTECEKIDSNYIGTLIARICYRLIAVITPGACQAEEAGVMYQRLKNDYMTLSNRGGVEEDEEAVNEFLAESDSAADVFAMELLVFDTLGDSRRTGLLLQMLEPEKVYSKACNRDLLSFALGHSQLDMARTITGNTSALDLHSALDVVLEKCPDGGDKAEMAAKLLQGGAYNNQDQDRMRDYLAGGDSPRTKAALIAASKGTGATPDMECVIQHVLSQGDAADLTAALDGVCSGHLHDEELYYLLEFALTQQPDKAVAVLNRLAASGQFAVVSGKHLKQLFLDTGRTPQQRLEIWQVLAQFQLDNKAAGIVVSEYLCACADSPDDRAVILPELFKLVTAVAPSTLERYLQSCTLDGDYKPAVLQALFALADMRPSYFTDALGKYLRSSPDAPQITAAVVEVLIGAGLTLDANGVNGVICDPNSPAASKVELLRQLERNGCRVRADALSTYLENCCNNFQEEVFAYLFDQVPSVSERGIANYVLYCSGVNKAQNAAALAGKQVAPMGASVCQVVHLSHRISCSLAQAYLLTSGDPYGVAAPLLNTMAGNTRLTDDVQVDGSVMRFKKYVKDNRASLSALTAQLCEEHRLFSMF